MNAANPNAFGHLSGNQFALQQQLHQAGAGAAAAKLLGLGMPPAAQGLQIDPNLLRNLLLVQGQLGGTQLPPPVRGTQQQHQQSRPDPPTEANATGMGGLLSAASFPTAVTSAAALPLLQGLAAQGQANLLGWNGGAVPAPTTSTSSAAAAARPKPHTSHLVDNSGTRRMLLYVPTDDDSISPYQVSLGCTVQYS